MPSSSSTASATTGKKKVKVSYLGNASTESASETVTINVRRR